MGTLVLGRNHGEMIVVTHIASGDEIIVSIMKPHRGTTPLVKVGFMHDEAKRFHVLRSEVRDRIMNEETPPTAPPADPPPATESEPIKTDVQQEPEPGKLEPLDDDGPQP